MMMNADDYEKGSTKTSLALTLLTPAQNVWALLTRQRPRRKWLLLLSTNTTPALNERHRPVMNVREVVAWGEQQQGARREGRKEGTREDNKIWTYVVQRMPSTTYTHLIH